MRLKMKHEPYAKPLSFLSEPSEEDKKWYERQDPNFDEKNQKRLRTVFVVTMVSVAAFLLFIIFNNVIYPRVNSDVKSVTVKARVLDTRESQDGSFIVKLATTEPVGENGPWREETIILSDKKEFSKVKYSTTFLLTYKVTTFKYWISSIMHRPGSSKYEIQSHAGPF
jgi:hypothetical protein